MNNIQRSMSKCGEGLHTYSSPGNSEGADRLDIGKAHPMNPRNYIRIVYLIGKEALGEIPSPFQPTWPPCRYLGIGTR